MFLNDTNKLDQHFLIDDKVINEFITVCQLNHDDNVLEIGAGNGTISKLIVPKVNSLTIIEKDTRLKQYLDNIDNVKVIYNNVLKEDIVNFNKIVTSLPYSITEPFIYKLIDIQFEKLIMICGKTFADNVLEQKDNKLALLTNLYFNVSKIRDIDAKCFNPKPRVQSSLIVLTPKNEKELKKYELILRYLYKYRYMKLKNALKEILIKIDGITQREARKIINNYNIDMSILNKQFDELSNNEVNMLFNCIKIVEN